MALENYCAACTYLGEKTDYTGKYYCEKKGDYYYATDPKCSRFCEAYSRRNSARENMYDNSESHLNNSKRCYLTTIMCKLIGYEDNNYYLNTLRKFRDTFMKTNSEYQQLLAIYDIIGPQVSQKLESDPNGKEIANTFFNKYISNATMAIEANKNQSAINIYVAMTHALAEKYQIQIPDSKEINIDEIDKTTLGHGKVRLLKTNY